jgi:hypothetical protein
VHQLPTSGTHLGSSPRISFRKLFNRTGVKMLPMPAMATRPRRSLGKTAILALIAMVMTMMAASKTVAAMTHLNSSAVADYAEAILQYMMMTTYLLSSLHCVLYCSSEFLFFKRVSI